MLFQNHITDPMISMLLASIDQSPIGITIADVEIPDMPLVYCNDAFVTLTGYPKNEVIGQNCRFLQGPDTDLEDVKKIREAIEHEKPLDIMIRNYRKNGEAFWNYLILSPVYNNEKAVEFYAGFQVESKEKTVPIKIPGNNPKVLLTP